MRTIMPAILGFIALTGGGCAYNQMRLVNYANSESPEVLSQSFGQASFGESATGETQILLQSSEPMTTADNRVLRQSIFVTTLWKPIPGKTYAEESQINARVVYLVEIAQCPDPTVATRKGPTVLCYKGTGFVSFDLDQTKQILTGKIERALLEPTHKTGGYRLGTFELSGEFKAARNPGAIGEFKITSGNLCQ
jgi:hypothetical protein